MATKHRRLLVTLPPDVDAVLTRFSEATGVAQSKFIVDCIRQNTEALNSICDAVDSARAGNKKEANDILNRAMGEAISSAMSQGESEKEEL